MHPAYQVDSQKNKVEWTVLELLQWAIRDFESKGVSEARPSAEVLLSHALKTDRVGLYVKYEEVVGKEEKELFRHLVEERRKGMPVAYLLGRKEFYSLPFSVNPKVLIPRPQTEILVDEALALLQMNGTESSKVLDIGTGSGAIAVSIKKNQPDADVSAVDISEDALEVARLNASSNEVDIEFFKGNLLEGVEGSFQMITANLPYIAEKECESLAIEIKNFEPSVAYRGGEDGLDVIRKLIDQVSTKQNAKFLLLEVGMGQGQATVEYLEQASFRVLNVRKDHGGIDRIVVAELK